MSLGIVDQVLRHTNILIRLSKSHDFLITVLKEKKMSVSNFFNSSYKIIIFCIHIIYALIPHMISELLNHNTSRSNYFGKWKLNIIRLSDWDSY